MPPNLFICKGAIDGIAPVNAAIIKIADEFASDMRKLATSGSPAELKTAVRNHIGMLEDLSSLL